MAWNRAAYSHAYCLVLAPSGQLLSHYRLAGYGCMALFRE
jgi:hypothetical protein